MKKYLYFIIILISLITASFSCLNNQTNDTFSLPYVGIQFKINFVNNSDSSVDINLNQISIGYKLFDNTPDIFESDEVYIKIDNYEPSIRTNVDKFIIYNKYNTLKLEKKENLSKLFSELYPRSQDSYGRDLKSIELDFTFPDGTKRVIAGWPEYYYNDLTSDIKRYGLLYFFKFDKEYTRLINEMLELGSITFLYMDQSGDIKGIKYKTIYSIQITISSPDDIKVEILPETGTPLPEDPSSDLFY